jgi:S-adenosyl-L-methionine hydrolase (adenosine-forming)
VLHIDPFGDLVTNFQASDFSNLKRFVIEIGRKRVTTWAKTYAENPPGKLLVIAGSTGYLEISVNQASAAALWGASPAALWQLVFK